MKIASGLLLLSLAIVWISPWLELSFSHDETAILLLVVLSVSAGLLYLVYVRSTAISKIPLTTVIIAGLFMRVIFFLSVPALEDDYYRYFLDGASVAHLVNPYTFAPSELPKNGPPFEIPLGQLERVNYPGARTIYPPVSQIAFLLSYWISPWDLSAWKFVLLLFDLATLLLLLALLKQVSLPSFLVGIYWWNPLLIRETFNAAHMDIVALPLVLAAVLLLFRNRPVYSVCLLSLATATKLWPILLLPLFLKFAHLQREESVAGKNRPTLLVLLFFGLTAALFLPVFVAGVDQNSGFLVYARGWQMNDSFFLILYSVLKLITKDAYLVARLFTIAIVLGASIYAAKTLRREPPDFILRALIPLSVAILVSPTQFPWYFVWILPFLSLCPVQSLLVLTMLLPIYYLRYFFDARGQVELFDYGIVWLQFVPVWWLLYYGIKEPQSN